MFEARINGICVRASDEATRAMLRFEETHRNLIQRRISSLDEEIPMGKEYQVLVDLGRKIVTAHCIKYSEDECILLRCGVRRVWFRRSDTFFKEGIIFAKDFYYVGGAIALIVAAVKWLIGLG